MIGAAVRVEVHWKAQNSNLAWNKLKMTQKPVLQDEVYVYSMCDAHKSKLQGGRV